jgi:hypothetical protein
VKAVGVAKLVATTEGAKPFKLYGNLLSNEASQPWEMIIKAQVARASWEDVYGILRDKTPSKTWDSFCECIKFHLQQVFHYDAGETLKYYITNMLKKANRVSIHQFFVQVEQLNSYLEMLPCLYYSLKANQATKKVLPLDDANLRLTCCTCVWPNGRLSTT